MDNKEINKELFKMSDIFCTEPIEFNNVLGEKLIGKLILNRIVNIAYKNLLRSKCTKLGEFERPLKIMYEENLKRAQICKENIEYVCKIMDKADFPYALLKGAYLITNVYELGDRISNDVDILINEIYVGACKKLLAENGFKQGNIINGVFKEASRMDIIMSKMNFGETIPFTKKIDGKYVTVDINFSVDYKPMKDDTLITKMLDKRIGFSFSNVNLVTLRMVDFIIYLCLHLYKEATTFDWVERRKDLNLYKFNDIYMLIYNKANEELLNDLAASIKEYGVEKECYYAFLHTMDIYPSLAEMQGYKVLLNKIRPNNIEYLCEIVNPIEKKIYKYEMDFIEWFTCEDRVANLKESRIMEI